MGDIGEIGKALKQRGKDNRQRRHRMNYAVMMGWVKPGYVAFQRKNRDTHWILLAFGHRFDFWPSTGTLHMDGRSDGQTTFKALIRRIEELRD